MEYRWHTFLANLDPVIGSEQGKNSTRSGNKRGRDKSNFASCKCSPYNFKKIRQANYSNEVIPAGIGGLEKESIVLCYQIRTFDKKRLTKEIGKIDDQELQEAIMDALCFQLGIIR